ncbi:Protein of unknown function [Geodermatophilus obscurus]|uniref:Pvc16 N-terminal domain-containing protein n=1 Tax=Geodermatophilus obscurus TaxID=1861 RepID=A0A1M7S3P0_9ACTN|nr:DUF4255 domain-containing protein [Geodermatophilus obscurus]SHN53053.1 Protein of unknown function [Geodermatophilus obscurus]
MTSELGIAAATYVLQSTLRKELTARDAAALLASPELVTALPPDRVTTGEQETSRLNVYLRQVTADPGLRNAELPLRAGDGTLRGRALLTLDLHYLISAYAAAELHADVLLGMAAQIMHEKPMLTAAMIREALPAGGSDTLLERLAEAGLADQVQTITLTPEALDTEELSRLWTAFQAPYRPSLAYTARVLLVEGRHRGRAAEPVRTWTTEVHALRRPRITALTAAGRPAGAPVLAGTDVEVHGEQLDGPDPVVLLRGRELAPRRVGPVSLVLTPPPGTPAGLLPVQVVHRIVFPPPAAGVPVVAAASNVAVLIYRPRVTGTSLAGDALTVQVEPDVAEGQQAAVLLSGAAGDRPPAYRLPAPSPPEEPGAVVVDVSAVLAGVYLVTVQVDGAESVLEADADGERSPRVTVT